MNSNTFNLANGFAATSSGTFNLARQSNFYLHRSSITTLAKPLAHWEEFCSIQFPAPLETPEKCSNRKANDRDLTITSGPIGEARLDVQE